MQRKEEVFFGPGVPCLGMYSAKDHSSLSPGQFKVLQNLRVRLGRLQVRGPIVAKNATGLDSGVIAGYAVVRLNGTQYELVAIDTSSVIKCYYSTGTAFTEFTNGAGAGIQYPNTRFATGGWVDFAVVRDQTQSTVAPFDDYKSGLDFVVASDGVTAVTLYNPGAVAVCAPIQQAWHSGPGKVRQVATYPYYTSLVATNTAAGATTGGGTITDNAAHSVTGGLTPTWTFAAVNDAAVLTITTGTTLAKNKQIGVLFDCPDDPTILESLKIEIYNTTAAAFKTLWDGSSATKEPAVIVPADKGFQLALFAVDPNVLADNTYTDIRVTYVGSANPAATVSFYLLGIYGSGKTPGLSQFGVSYFNSGSRTESIFVVCDDKGGKNTRSLGCQDSRNYIPLPHNLYSYYSYEVTYQNVSTANIALGLDFALFYRRQVPQKTFYHVASDATAVFSAGSWGAGGGRTQLADITLTIDTDALTLRPAPDAYNTCIPPSATMASSGGRLFCGSGRSANASATAKLADAYVSEQDMPFRMRDVLRVEGGVPDPTSGTKISILGEKIQRIVTIAGAEADFDPVLIFTDQSVYSVGGTDSVQLSRARRIWTHGTLSPRSIGVRNNQVVFLDAEKRLVTLDPSLDILSSGKVEDILTAIPDSRLPYVYGCVFRDRYFMSYTIGGGSSNTPILVYDFVNGVFTRDLTLDAINPGPLFVFSNEVRFWDEAGALYTHDATSGTADPSNGIKPYVEGRMVGGLWHQNAFDQLGIHCQEDHGNTLSCYWTGRPSGWGQLYNPGTVSLTPKTMAVITPASTSTGGDTVTFGADQKVTTGQLCTPQTTAGGLTAGTNYYLNQNSTLIYSFHTTLADAIAGSSPVNLTASIGALNLLETHVRDKSLTSTGAIPAIEDGGAYPVWTGTMTAGKEIYLLVGDVGYAGVGV